ncbi:RNA binding protein / RBP28 [Leishmania donovani]|uniref:Uncharacterized protein n=3 Tax=Leishmania donovani species complex TaxID=38574 RepID=A4I1F0_LEIIN|nr:conserved hypothetical protein [Leishmania infantum JPCM5]XP_003861442.1 hypothetical protein, conserved [Leishmania donovani]CAC9494131.1 hypothetical_protein_-_conserved [Leishmania infantum]AYU79445.1 hypothetical protein LdCL_250016600 [Leishmania donovani]CAJ1989437.1 RNA binding protein / RBP28 [Leishmania donovani]CAM68580.1 conserved hypothetical protein [Leishmania infantum JPCM5]CBZ34742.1 hypothetical protein, conserved [Leishmania donovani]|eukprot:XP_001466141.1 conserved hypothetical protein [Leishmania infantum JPCM5]
MPAKQKKGRGKTVNLFEFNEDYIPEEALDWAEDDWMTAEQVGVAKLSEKIAKQRQEYSRMANNTLDQQESFRTAAVSEQKKCFTIDDLQPPFVAHFGNLRNGTTEEDFLSLFNRDAIATHRLINQDGKSFAFVEFVSAQALTVALSLDQTFQRGRRMYVDLATQKQVERLLNRNTNERPGMSRDSAGQQQPGGLAAMGLSRDVFGGQQPEDQPGMPSMGSRSNFGSRVDLHNLGDLSRDMLGSAVQQASPTSCSPICGAGSPMSFGNWRSDAPEQQPEFPISRENCRSEDSFDRRAGHLRRSSGPASPAPPVLPPEPKPNPFSGETGNWRDAPRAEVPKMEELSAVTAEGDTTTPSEHKTEEHNAGGASNSGAASSPSSNGRGRGAGGIGRGGSRGGRGGAGSCERSSFGGERSGFGGERSGFGGERSAPPKPSGPVNTDKWADLRRS